MSAAEIVAQLRATGWDGEAWTSEGARVVEWLGSCPACGDRALSIRQEGGGVVVACSACEAPRARLLDALGVETTAELLPVTAASPVDPFVRLADVEEQAIRWWWPGRLAWGMAAVLAGDGGLGKSTLAQEWAARMSRGQPLPGGEAAPARDVIVLTAEEHIGAVVRGRMRHMGADLERVHVVDPEQAGVSFPSGLEALEREVARTGAGLVVIDTGPAFMDAGLRSNTEEHIRQFMAPLARVAERHDLVMVVLVHLNKAPDEHAGRRIMGGAAWRNAPRVVLVAGAPPGQDPRETAERVLAVEKSNLGAYPPAQGWRIIPAPEDPARGIVAWGPEQPGVTADMLVSRPQTADERGERADCEAAISDALADGPRPAAECEAELQKAGFTKATIRRAREALGISRRENTVYQEGFRGPYFWRLPTGAHTDAHPCADDRGEHPCENPHQDSLLGPSEGVPEPTGAQTQSVEHPWASVAPEAPSGMDPELVTLLAKMDNTLMAGRRVCVRCREPWPGPGTVCEECLDGEAA
mgnify:CR=1 FL=1